MRGKNEVTERDEIKNHSHTKNNIIMVVYVMVGE